MWEMRVVRDMSSSKRLGRAAAAAARSVASVLALTLVASAARAYEVRFSADTESRDFLVSPGASRGADDGHRYIRLERGASISTRESISLPKTGFSALLRVRLNELGDPTSDDKVHNHLIVGFPWMVLIVTWGDVLVWHLAFPEQGKAAEINTRVTAGREVALGWVVGPEAMTAYVDGQVLGRVRLPVPLAERAAKPGPITIGGPYGADRALSLDVFEFVYADEPWDEAQMMARSAGTTARLIPEGFSKRPLRGTPTLARGDLRVWLDPATGGLDGFADGRVLGSPVARSLDVYRVLSGACSSESEDTVVSMARSGSPAYPEVRVTCRNKRLGLRVIKHYKLGPVAGELTKSITLAADRPMVVGVEARTLVSEAFRKRAFYTQWLHHTHGVRLFIPAAEVEVTRSAAPDAKMQSQLVLLTRPDLNWTYGEVPLEVDGEVAYPAIPDGVFGRRTLLTPDGWQAQRGVVAVGPGEEHTLVVSYRWLPTSHLGYLRDYVSRVYRPAFAPQPGSTLVRRNLACDATSVFLCNLARPEGDRLVYTGESGVWAVKRLSGIIARIAPEAYATMVVFEGFSHGDLLSDNVYQWIPEDRGGPPKGKTNIFRASINEYMRIMHLVQAEVPRLVLGRYERVALMSYVEETPRKRPDILADDEEGAPTNPAVYAMPYFWEDQPAYERPVDPLVYFDLLGDYFVRLIGLGLPIAYLDWSVPAPYVRGRAPSRRLVSWSQHIAAVRNMALKVHSAGGTYFVNLPSGPYADLGYMEYTPWQADNARDWRVLADRLQLTKAQEMLPNTTIPLYFQGPDYPMRCLAYNLVPNPFFSGWFDGSGTGPVVTEELLKLRWALRDAEMTGVLVRPLPWEPGAPPIEACVMRLGAKFYVPLMFHGNESDMVEITADLRGELSDKAAPVWLCEFIRAPWNGPLEAPYTTERVKLRFTRLDGVLDERGVLRLRLLLHPEKLAMVLIGDWTEEELLGSQEPVSGREGEDAAGRLGGEESE